MVLQAAKPARSIAAVTWVVGLLSHLEGLLLSAAVVEPAGAGEVAGRVRASAIVLPNAFVKWKTIVVSFGVLIPEIGLSAVADVGAPAMLAAEALDSGNRLCV